MHSAGDERKIAFFLQFCACSLFFAHLFFCCTFWWFFSFLLFNFAQSFPSQKILFFAIFFWKSDLKYHFNIGWNDFNLWFFENYVFICDIISIFFVYKGSYHSTKRYKKNGKSRKINRKCLKQLFFLEKEQGWKETKLMDKAFCFLFFVFCFIRFGSFLGDQRNNRKYLLSLYDL